MAKLTEANILLLDHADDAFATELQAIEKTILDRVIDLMDDFNTVGGYFDPTQDPVAVFGKLKKDIRAIIQKSNYSSSVDDYLRNFDGINKNIRAIQKEFNGINIPKSLVNPVQDAMIKEVTDNLLSANIDSRFVNPIKKVLFNQINLGGSLKNARETVNILITGKDKDGLLKKYAGQVARDSANQYEGIINQVIKVEFELKNIMYVGPLLTDSRKQCRRWVEMGIIPDSKLAAEIAWAYEHGSGMIPGTEKQNFCANRGGFRCIHTAIPKR